MTRWNVSGARTDSEKIVEKPRSMAFNVSLQNEPILKNAELEYLMFHDLRHAFATTALQNSVDVKAVSSMLGHFDAGFTPRACTHATRQKRDEAAQAMGLHGAGLVRERKCRAGGANLLPGLLVSVESFLRVGQRSLISPRSSGRMSKITAQITIQSVPS